MAVGEDTMHARSRKRRHAQFEPRHAGHDGHGHHLAGGGAVAVRAALAAPEEVEEVVNVRIEEAVQGIDGIKQVQSTAAEGWGR